MIEQDSAITRPTLSFLLVGTSCALMSALSHTRAHRLSQVFLCATLLCSTLAFLKIINSVAQFFPRAPRNFIQSAHAFIFIHPLTRVQRLRKKLQNTVPESQD